MPRARTASGRHTITIYEDETNNPNHNELAPALSIEPPDGASPLHDITPDDNQIYIPVAEYKYDENEMLNKLEALGKLSQSIHSAAPRSRSVSAATMLTQEDDDPFVDDDEQDGHGSIRHSQDALSERRYTSDTFSEMPPELDIPGTYRSPTPVSEYQSPTQKQARLRLDRTSGLYSSPYSTTSDRAMSPRPQRFSATPRSPVSSPQRSSTFRNPSSIRAVQMSSSSPPPFVHSPRSARHRNSTTSRSGTPQYLRADSRASHFKDTTPTRSPLSQHPDPRKEYPLVLLHCTVGLVTLPYSQATLQSNLPPFVLEDLALLKEKITSNILDRGVLISHPGEDYELLEERILESLELRRPRLGKCGHFQPTSTNHSEYDTHNVTGEDDNGPSTPSHADFSLQSTNPVCTTCVRPHSTHATTDASNCASPDDIPRRWDLRVYAANGLLRAGAWSAAWREMEQVDLEIGVWIPEDMRRALDREEVEQQQLQRAKNLAGDTKGNETTHSVDEGDEWNTNPPTPSKTSSIRKRQSASRSRNVSSSSTASTARTAPSRPSFKKRNSEPHRLPLTTLLHRYLQRQLTSFQRPEWLVLLFITVIGLTYMLVRPTLTGVHDGVSMVEMIDVLPSGVPSALKGAEGVVGGLAAGLVDGVERLWQNGGHVDVPVCTFPPSAVESAGMTALPEDVARRILSYLATPGLSASTSTSTTTSTSIASSTTTSTSSMLLTETESADGAEPTATTAGIVREVLEAVGKVVVPDGVEDIVGD